MSAEEPLSQYPKHICDAYSLVHCTFALTRTGLRASASTALREKGQTSLTSGCSQLSIGWTAQSVVPSPCACSTRLSNLRLLCSRPEQLQEDTEGRALADKSYHTETCARAQEIARDTLKSRAALEIRTCERLTCSTTSARALCRQGCFPGRSGVRALP